MKQATITIACNILQNTAVVHISCLASLFVLIHLLYHFFSKSLLLSQHVQTQEQRGVANGISVTLMSMFKAVAPAAAGTL